jgi:hypothetical protein
VGGVERWVLVGKTVGATASWFLRGQEGVGAVVVLVSAWRVALGRFQNGVGSTRLNKTMVVGRTAVIYRAQEAFSILTESPN